MYCSYSTCGHSLEIVGCESLLFPLSKVEPETLMRVKLQKHQIEGHQWTWSSRLSAIACHPLATLDPWCRFPMKTRAILPAAKLQRVFLEQPWQANTSLENINVAPHDLPSQLQPSRRQSIIIVVHSSDCLTEQITLLAFFWGKYFCEVGNAVCRLAVPSYDFITCASTDSGSSGFRLNSSSCNILASQPRACDRPWSLFCMLPRCRTSN